ncbi:hypothetical protein [Lederbergia citri]|uniref:Uncharacterized protein n=1 Tax=Lederbergia citri TaxID=2833580 RepID=A0A942TEL7_9BACI|nr:hypothetical protein [Lederbergia citri]MBS4195361.1 hypothetical protein [Lederbergia citri]
MIKSRRERREEARNNKTKFEPIYNGKPPVMRTDYERFNNKFVTIKEESE